MSKKYVNRRAKDYHKTVLPVLTLSDLIASELLALSYSRKASPTKISQSLIQMDCVAVCFVGKELWVASNSQDVNFEDIDCLRLDLPQSLQEVDIYVVCNGNKGEMHAEMQLLSELYQAKINPSGLAFGVSKPCCLSCKGYLDTYKISYSRYHDTSITNWQEPF